MKTNERPRPCISRTIRGFHCTRRGTYIVRSREGKYLGRVCTQHSKEQTSGRTVEKVER